MRTSGGAPAARGLAPGHARVDGFAGQAGAALRGGAGPWRRRVLTAGAWAAGTGAAFAVYLRLAQTRAVNSDGASQALQAWDMLHGNPLLRGWTVSDVSFYTTELPQYALVELIRGLHPDVVTTCAAMTYTLVVLLAALVAVGRAPFGASPRRGVLLRVAVAAGILLAPQLGSGTNQLLSSPDHIGTCVPLLLTWLVLDRCYSGGTGGRPPGGTGRMHARHDGGLCHRACIRPRHWYVPVITSALLCLAEVADSITLVAGIIPLALVCAVRAARSARRRSARDAGYELAMAGGALAAAGAASAILRAITDAGGFTVRPLGTALAPLGEIFSHNVPVAGQCLLLLFGAYTGGPPTREVTFFLLLHLAGVVLAALGVAAAAWRLRGGGDLVSQVLLAGIAVNLGAFVVTQRAVDVTSAREIAPVLPFAAALAARQLAPGLGWLARPTAKTAIVSGTQASLPPGGTTPRTPRPAHPTAKTAIVSGTQASLPPGGTTPRTPRPAHPTAKTATISGTQASLPPGGTTPRTPRPAHPTAKTVAGRVRASLPRLAGCLLVVIGAGYAAGLGVELTAPSTPPQAAKLTAWLTRHQLGGSGLGGYWQASVVTLTSGGTVAIRPIADDGNGVGAHPGEVKDAWFDPGQSVARFVVLSPGAPGYPGYADYAAVRATWGPPARVYHVGEYTIWYWPKNLLSTIRH